MTTTGPRPSPSVIWEHNLEVADQIIQSVEEGVYCAVLGPRFWGKSSLLAYVCRWMEENSLACMYINLFDNQTPTQLDFFAGLAASIAEWVSSHSGRSISLPAEQFTSAAFRDFLARCVEHLGRNFTVIFDHLEGLPADLNRALLTSLRALHMEQQDRDLRFIAIVSGALSLAALTVGETSPFHGIARRFILGDLEPGKSEAFVNSYLASEAVDVTETARAVLLEATRGNPYLIKLICRHSLAAAEKNPSRQVTAQTVNRVVREFLRVEAPNYGPLQEAIRITEDDPELLQCVLKLLKSDIVPRRELPLPVFPDLDPLYLTGLVERVGESGYRIRNGIYRQYLSDYFDAARTGYLLTVSGRWDAAIGHLEESTLSGNDISRAELLAATINAMYASESPEQAAYYILRGLSAVFGVSQISIWLLERDGESLRLLDRRGTSFDGALSVDVQEIPVRADRIEARSYRQACLLRELEESACIRYVVPLMGPGRSPVGVVSLTDCAREETAAEYRKREFELQSYLNQAGRALYEVEFRREREVRASEQDAQLEKQTHQLLLLHRISTLSQTIPDQEKVAHLILTAITANFGLAFNRAWLFILDREKSCLTGRMGIGDMTAEQAYQAWAEPPTFDRYMASLQKDQLARSAIDPPTRELSLPVSERSQDLFSMTVVQQHTFHWSGAPGHWHELPREFRQTFEPGEMILTPLVIHNTCLGLIAVDNKFRPRPYTDTDDLLLKTFANQMAAAIFNIQQHDREARRLQLEETLRETSRAIGSSLESDEVLDRILDEMKKVLPFDSASIQTADEEAGVLRIIASKGFEDPEHVKTLVFPLKGNFPNVLVYESREPLHLEDVQKRFANFRDPYYRVTGIHGWLGAPLISNDRVIGVITLDSTVPGIYTSEHDRMAVLFAAQASIALGNARLFEEEKRTKEYLDLLISSSQDGIIAVDNRGKVLRYSEGAQKILGYSPEEVRRRRVDELYGSLDVARQINAMLKASDRVRDYPTSILDSENQAVPILLSASLLRDRDGSPVGSVGFFKDLRPLKKVENNLRMLLDTVSIMSGVDQSEKGLYALAKRIVTAQPVTFCSIFLLDESKQNLILKAAYPVPRPAGSKVRWDPAIGKNIPLQYEGLMAHLLNLPASQVFKQGQKIREMDVLQHIHQNIRVHDEIRSILVVPLKAGSQVFGICILAETRSWNRSPFDEEKVELIGSMVTQGMVFVDRLQAHEATENKLMMVERLRLIGEDLVAASSGSAKSILDKVVRAAYEVMGASSTIIYPWDQETKTYDTEKIAYFGLRKEKSFSGKVRRDERSMTRIVLHKGMIIVDDIQKGLDRSQEIPVWVDPGGFMENEGVQAFVGMSLRGVEGPLGVLFVNYSEPHYFSGSELEAVNLFANQAVIAIENARLYEDLDQRLKEIQTLQKLGTFLAETRDLGQVFDRVMQAAFELIHADSGNILVYEESRDEFREEALTTQGKNAPLQPYQTRVRQRSGYSHQMIKSRRPIRVYDTKLDSSINPVMLEKGRRASLGVPLIGRESPVGVIWLHWKNPRRIPDREEELLLAIAGQAAVAIENIELFEQRNEESLALQKVGISLTEPIELNQVLNRVLQTALELVDGAEDSILFYNESRGEFDEEALICRGPDRPLETYKTQDRQRTGLTYQIVRERRPKFIPDTQLDPLANPDAAEKNRRAMLGVPLFGHDGFVGVLTVFWKQSRPVSTREIRLLTALASQATVAIKGARRYDELKRRSAHHEAVHEAGRVISAASVGLERQQVLDRILEEAVECITGVSGRKASFGTISLLEQDTKDLVVKSIYPRGHPGIFIEKFARISVDTQKPRTGRIGISGRTVITGQAQLVPDVSRDDDYIVQDENTRSELVIPLLDEGRVIGVMDLESDELNAFDELDKDALTLLVDMAVIALRNADQADELTRSNAVGLMGAWGAEVVHVVNREVGHIRREVFLMRQNPDLSEDVREGLRIIDQSAEELALPEIPERIPDYGSMVSPASCLIDETIKTVMDKYRSGQPKIEISFEPGCGARRVALHEKFLYSIVRNLLRNAGFALAQTDAEKVIRMRSRVEGSMAVFEIQDSGPGLPSKIIPDLFRRLIPQEDERKGRGLLLVGFIVRQHGGRVEIVPTPKGEGAFFRVWLPLAATAEKSGQPG